MKPERNPIERLQQELRQNKPFRSPAHAASLALLRTADEIRRRATAQLACPDVSLEQYNVLRILRGAGPEGLPTLEIAARMVERQPGITRLLDKLESKGFVRRERCRQDRRQVLCTITAAGETLLAQLDGPVTQATEENFADFAPEQIDALIDLLDRIRYPQSLNPSGE